MTNIKERIGRKRLEDSVRRMRRRRAYYTFENAKSIGIVFDATHQETYLIAKSFIAGLRKKNIDVSALGFVANQDAVAYFPYHKGTDFFAITNVNWYFKPINPCIDEFHKKSFNMLIDLSMSDLLPVKYIIGLANAEMKIGIGKPDSIFYDFIVDTNETKSLNWFIDQISLYLNQLKIS